jgi:folate-binding protein YgfZ
MQQNKSSLDSQRVTGFYNFTSPLILKVEGKDTVRYLNARLTYNIKKLSHQRGALDPKGRTEGLFTVLQTPEAENTFYLVSLGGEVQEVLTAFKRYLVADRVTVTDCSQDFLYFHLCIGETSWRPVLENKDVILPNEFSVEWFNNACILRHRRLTHPGYDLLLPRPQAQALLGKLHIKSSFPEITTHDFELGRYLGGSPSFPKEISSKRVFLEAGIVAAISANKGCYTGQEVVERVDALGKLPRHVLRTVSKIETKPTEDPQRILLPDGTVIGDVLSSLYDEESKLLVTFASVKSSVEIPTDVRVDAETARLLPLSFSDSE